MKNVKQLGGSIWGDIRRIDGVLHTRYVYHYVLLLIVAIIVFLFGQSFYTDKVYKNYQADDSVEFRIVRNMKYNMSFEAQDSSLSSFRLKVNSDRTRLSSSDKVHVVIYDSEDNKIYEDDTYLYNADRNYVKVDVDGLSLEKGEWYYIRFSFPEMARNSLLVLDTHKVNSFGEAIQYAQDVDENGDPLSLDMSIGFKNVANINYYYGTLNWFSLVLHLVLFGVALSLLFVKKLMASTVFRNFYRLIVLPVFMYLAAEVMNIEKERPLNFLYPLSRKTAFVVLTILLLLSALILLFHMITGKGTAAALIVGIPFLTLAFVNHTKLVMRGDSFMPWDLMSAGIAVKTGSTYYFHVTSNFIAGILMCIAIMLLIRLTDTPYIKFSSQRASMMAFSTASVLLILVSTVFNTKLLDRLNIYYEVNPPIQSYNENGTYMAFLMHLNNLGAKSGNSNSPETYNDMIYRYTGMASSMDLDSRVNGGSVRPNVICIMSEAYADLTEIRDFETSEPVMPYFDSLKDECMYGDIAVSIFGGGTCNTEFEFLTGYSMAYLLPGSSVYTFYVNNDIDALPSIYSDNGYRTVALHSFDGDWWDRREKYPLLGFDEFYTRDDFGPDAQYVRRYISDLETFHKITDIYDESEEPLFLFCVTMQNHADFADHYDNMAYDIHLTDLAPDDGSSYYYAENYLSLIRESDDALEYLIEYLRDSDEPTIVCFFGDHCPTLDPGFYEELLQTDLGGITLEESVPIYQTPYFIWANYDLSAGGTTIATTAGNHGLTSPNFLGQTVLDLSGIDSPDSRSCLRVLQQEIGAISSLGVFDSDGVLHTDTTYFDADTQGALEDYATIQYGLIYLSGSDTSAVPAETNEEEES